MPFLTRRWLAVFCCCCLRLGAAAQAKPPADGLRYHPLRTTDPADADFADLTSLGQEIGAARVVMLGESSHGEGNVFAAKIRLVRYLQRQGFTTVAFESGFYELARAQQDLEAGQSPATCLNKSLFPVWTHSREFQPLLALVGPGKLKVAGFDPQLSGEYGEELVEDLQAFLGPGQPAQEVPYDYLEEVIGVMGSLYTFPPTQDYALFDLAIGKASKQLRRVAATEPRRRARAGFWLQCLAGLNALARDYARNDPGAKTSATFEAQDSNVRDRLMADNLLWYLRQHPQERVICWGATAHFAGPFAGLQNAELQAYRPMGALVKAALPAGQVYVLGTTTAHGAHGPVYTLPQAVPPPAPGSLEAQLDALGPECLFVPMRQPALEKATSSLLDYQPISGNWTQVLDGLLFLKTVRPPTLSEQLPPLVLRDSLRLAQTGSGLLAAAARPRRSTVRVAASGPAGGQLRGVVLDQATGAAVPFASVYLQRLGVGRTTDIRGGFELPRPAAADSLVATSLGFGRRAVAVPGQPFGQPSGQPSTQLSGQPSAPLSGQPLVRLLLPPQRYALADVSVKAESLDPRKIMARVLQRLPQNYPQQAYGAEVYARASSTNFDSLLYDVEYVSTLYDALGYRSVGQRVAQPREVRWNKELLPGYARFDYHFANACNIDILTDLVDQNPLFQARTLKKYTYSLQNVIQEEGRETLVLAFVANKKTHRTTGDYYDRGFSGKLYIDRADYAVTRCEVEWQRDTLTLNSFARKYFARGGQSAQFFHQLYRDYRIRQTETYQQLPGGQYVLCRSVQTWVEKYQDMITGRPVEKLSVLSMHYTNVRTTNPEVLPERVPIDSLRLTNRPLHENFWRTYQRPGSLRAASEPTGPTR